MQTFLLAVVLIIIVALLVAFGYKKFNGGGYEDDYKFLLHFNELVDDINKHYAYQNPQDFYAEKVNKNLDIIIKDFPRVIAITKTYLHCKPCVIKNDDEHYYHSVKFNRTIGSHIRNNLELIIRPLTYSDEYQKRHMIPDYKIAAFIKFYEEFEPISIEIDNSKDACPICSETNPNTGLRTKPALRKEYDPEDDEDV